MPGARYPTPGPPLVPSGPRGVLVPQPRPVKLILEHLRFERMQIDLFDATVAAPKPHRLEFDDTQADIANVALPPLNAVAVSVCAPSENEPPTMSPPGLSPKIT